MQDTETKTAAGGNAPGKDTNEPATGGQTDNPTCAICLESYTLENAAFVKGCEHGYCACCILTWAMHKEDAWCPQCKQPFSYLVCCRQLDGTLSEYAAEESVALLKRARWFQDHLEGQEERISQVAVCDAYEDEYEEEDPDDYYFSSAAGAARVVIGNRRSGPNGYMRSGRMYARPARTTPAATASTGAGSSGSKGGGAGAPARSPAARNNKGGAAAGAASAQGPPAKQAQAQAATPGRRARRNAKRAAADDGTVPF